MKGREEREWEERREEGEIWSGCKIKLYFLKVKIEKKRDFTFLTENFYYCAMLHVKTNIRS